MTQMTAKRQAFLYQSVFNNENAKELLTHIKDGKLLSIHKPTQDDPNGINIIREMAILEFIQGLLVYSENQEETKIETKIKENK